MSVNSAQIGVMWLRSTTIWWGSDRGGSLEEKGADRSLQLLQWIKD